MTLVIDGYNLLHASGILGRGVGPGGLERSRLALLNFLVESLDDRERSGAIVVFDARTAPPGLPRVVTHRGLTVRFAEPGNDADGVIEELVQKHSSPRRLVVVSSDHRLHRAARRRRAKAIDSDQWYAAILRRRLVRHTDQARALKPGEPESEIEVRFWLKQFGIEEEAPSAARPTSDDESFENPFPPGYADEIEEDETGRDRS